MDLNQPLARSSLSRIHELPASLYAAQLPADLLERDILELRDANVDGSTRWEAGEDVEQRHYMRNGYQTIMAAIRYVNQLAQLIYLYRGESADQVIARLRPSPEDLRHWMPLINAVGILTADSYTWRHEESEIQCYRNDVTRGFLYIGVSGQFYDRHSRPISREIAMKQAFPLHRPPSGMN